MRDTNWASWSTFGGESLTSRRTGKRIAATDHCVAIVKRCAECLETYVARPGEPHVCEKPS